MVCFHSTRCRSLRVPPKRPSQTGEWLQGGRSPAGTAASALLHCPESFSAFCVRQARASKLECPAQYFAASSAHAARKPPRPPARPPGSAATFPPGPTGKRPPGSGAVPARNQSGDLGFPEDEFVCENPNVTVTIASAAVDAVRRISL